MIRFGKSKNQMGKYTVELESLYLLSESYEVEANSEKEAKKAIKDAYKNIINKKTPIKWQYTEEPHNGNLVRLKKITNVYENV